MKIEIQEEGKEKQFFFTFKEASEATEISISTIWKFLKNKFKKHDKFVRQKDRNVFWIREEKDKTFIQVDGENFFSIDKNSEKFGVSRTILINQLLRKDHPFLDSKEISHFVTWKSEDVEKFLDSMKKS